MVTVEDDECADELDESWMDGRRLLQLHSGRTLKRSSPKTFANAFDALGSSKVHYAVSVCVDHVRVVQLQ